MDRAKPNRSMTAWRFWPRLLMIALALIAVFLAAASAANQEMVLAKIVVSDLDGFASQYGAMVHVVQIDLGRRTVTALNVTIGDVTLYGKLEGGIATLYYRGPACWLLEIADSPYVASIYVKVIPVFKQMILRLNETSTEPPDCPLSHGKIHVVDKIDDPILSSDYILSSDNITVMPATSKPMTVLETPRPSIDSGQALRIALISIVGLLIIALLSIRCRKRA